MNITKNKDKIYISGPMSGRENHNFELFNEVEKFWRSEGYNVYNPACKGVIEGWDWEDYLRVDIIEIATNCFAMVVLPEWETSKGASLEVHIAKELQMPIFDAFTMDPIW